MLSPKTNQLLNAAIDHLIREAGPRIGKQVQAVKFDFARRGTGLSSMAEQQMAQVHIEAMQQIANDIWKEIKRVLQEVCVQPYAQLETDVTSILKSKLSQLQQMIVHSYQRNRSPHYTFQDQLPRIEIAFKQVESKVCNEVAIFCASLEAKQSEKEDNRMSSNINYHLHGNNPRININSQDYSINIANSKIVFDEIHKLVDSNITDENLKNDLHVKTSEMENSVGKKTFLQKYSEFMALAANHVTVFAPLLPALTQFLTSSSS